MEKEPTAKVDQSECPEAVEPPEGLPFSGHHNLDPECTAPGGDWSRSNERDPHFNKNKLGAKERLSRRNDSRSERSLE